MQIQLFHWTRERLRAILIDRTKLPIDQINHLSNEAVRRGGATAPDLYGAYVALSVDCDVDAIVAAQRAIFLPDD